MAFPSVTGSQLSSRASNAEGDTVTLPASVAAGDLVIVFHFAESSVTRTWSGSFVEIKDAAGGGPETIGIAYLIASGGETSVTVTKSSSERFAAIAIKVSAASWHGTTPPEVSTGATGNSNTPDADAVTASWGSDDNLFIACFVIDTPDTRLPVTAWPTNYSDNQTESAADFSSAGGAIASRELAAASDNPGSFTTTNSETWWAGTVVVRPSGGAPPAETEPRLLLTGAGR